MSLCGELREVADLADAAPEVDSRSLRGDKERGAPSFIASGEVYHRAPSSAQAQWATLPLRERLEVLRRTRQQVALQAEMFANAISPSLPRSRADTLVAEVLPLLDACRFLERNAELLLQSRKLRRAGRPFWLTGVYAEVRREPLGRVLIIGPANFPLFLPGVQTLQALAAGNAVVWKPGAGGESVARLLAKALGLAGLPAGVLQITGEAVEHAAEAIASAPDKVIFTGSSDTGRRVLEQLAPRLIPATLELSGTDAVIVLGSADLRRVAKAVAFGLRLNGAAVCMCPRRLIATRGTLEALRPLLREALTDVPPVVLGEATAELLEAQVSAATRQGAEIDGVLAPRAQRPLLVIGAGLDSEIAKTAFFAPLLVLIETPTDADAPRVCGQSPYALSASIFGEEKQAFEMANNLRAGSVLINDLIAPTADPRLPFGGRGESGYGVTRGAEGLLEMTAVKVVQVRRNGSTRHFEPTTEQDVSLFAALIRVSHASGWRERAKALRQVVKSARRRAKA